MDVLENIDYSAFQGEMMNEIEQMMGQMIDMQIYSTDTYNKYAQYSHIYVNNNSLQVTEKMAHEIKWLIHYVKETHLYLYEDYKDDMLEKFDRVTEYLPYLFDLYDAYTDNDRDGRHTFQPVHTLKNIRQLLLPFRDCVDREKFDTTYVDHCVNLLEFYKFTANFMICRLQELEFDIDFMKKNPDRIQGYEP
jgi:hypothetical protein|uniref:Uncharacterized protein n=1 Tax=viral metagenome TaxID=1070528 RepID=A0A6C0IIU8_9ZZZZ